MITFLIYMLKVAACIIVFYAVYKLALSKESFFRLNRIVILTSVILSLILPIYTITISKEVIQEVKTASPEDNNMIMTLDDLPTATASSITFSSKNKNFPWIGLSIFIIYLIGVLFILTKQIIGHTQIILLIKGSKREGNIFLTDHAILPFSWFRRIVINKSDYKKNGKTIIAHEQAHIQSKHFYDLMFVNLLTAIQWFNPFAWLLKRELIANHEFSADEYVINQGINAKQYQLLLIAKATYGNAHIPVVSHLYSGSLVQRVKMMLEKKSKSTKLMKALLMLPFIFCAILAFAETKYVELPAPELIYQTEDSTAINIKVLKNGNLEIDGKTVESESKSEAIKQAVSEFRERTGIEPIVKISADPKTEMGVIANLKIELRKANINKISHYERIEFSKEELKTLIQIMINSEDQYFISYPTHGANLAKDLKKLEFHIDKAIKKITESSGAENIKCVYLVSHKSSTKTLEAAKDIIRAKDIENIEYINVYQ